MRVLAVLLEVPVLLLCSLSLAGLTGLAQPWRCLCRGSEQMTMTRPCRRMIRHLLQIFFTLGLTFIGCSSRSLVAVDDPPTTQVVGAQLDDDPVIGKDPDVVHPHLSADVSQDLVPVV